MSKFIDPPDVDERLSWSKWNVKNILYISTKANENSNSTIHFSGPNHQGASAVPLDTTNPDLIVQVALMIPSEWCKVMAEGGHFNDGFYCKLRDDDTTPMAMNMKWSEFEVTDNNTIEAFFNVSKLGHKFKLVWVQMSDPQISPIRYEKK